MSVKKARSGIWLVFVLVVFAVFKAAMAQALTPPPPPQIDGSMERLVRPQDDYRVYILRDNNLIWIPSAAAFAGRGFSWSEVEVVSPSELTGTKRARLIRASGDEKIYYVTNAGFKRHVPSPDVFLSYGNRWEDVVEVEQRDVDMYPFNTLIRASGGVKVWWLSQGQKYWIATPQAFLARGFKWENIAPVNEVELSRYPEGPAIN